jgi:DNA-binding HxlR family transcriptional regulator
MIKYSRDDIVISWSVMILEFLFEKGPLKDNELKNAMNLVPSNLTPFNEATLARALEYLVDSGKIHFDKYDERWMLG